MALVAIQKCLNLHYDVLGPNHKKLGINYQSIRGVVLRNAFELNLVNCIFFAN